MSTLSIGQALGQAFFLAIFSKLKGGKTQRFSKLKQIFCKTQGKYLKTQHFGKFCCEEPFFNIVVNEVTMTSLTQFLT